MDIVTQGILGASLAQAAAGPREARVATLIGFAAGLLPDVDALVRSDADPLLFLEYHRHFTHALAFVPFGAAIAALLLWPVLGRRLPVRRVYLYAFLGYALAGVLDACTSYGTHLFWPFSDRPVAWSIVAIVDPLFTAVLAIALALGLRSRTAVPARAGLLLALAYLGFAAWQHERAELAAHELALARGHAPERLLVKPTLGNVVLWRSLYLHEGRLRADAIRVGLLGQSDVYPGQSAPLVTSASQRASPDDAIRDRDWVRFSRFADGWLVRHPERRGLIGDARFALLPTSLRPLWGIEPDPALGHARARFVTDRRMRDGERQRFLRMLLGEPVAR